MATHLDLGDAIEVEGHAYVIISWQTMHDATGRSVNLFAKDPLLAQSMLDEARQRRQVLDLAAMHLREGHD